AAVLAGRVDHQPALADVVRARLLDVDVLARGAGEDGGRGVPVVGGGDEDRVDRPVGQHAAQVPGGLRPAARRPLDRLGGGVHAVAVRVADPGNLHVLAGEQGPDVVHPHAAGADDADDDALVGAAGAAGGFGGSEGRGPGGGQAGLLEETSAV